MTLARVIAHSAHARRPIRLPKIAPVDRGLVDQDAAAHLLARHPAGLGSGASAQTGDNAGQGQPAKLVTWFSGHCPARMCLRSLANSTNARAMTLKLAPVWRPAVRG